MRKILHYTLRITAIFAGVVIILYSLAFIYISLNKQKIITRVNSELREKLNGDIEVKNVEISFFTNFPYLAVLFQDFTIRDSLYHTHKHTFFSAKKFYANISLANVLLRQEPLSGLRIHDAALYVYTDTSGYTNSYLFTPRKKIADTLPKTDKEGNFLKHVRVENFRFTLDNTIKHKLYDIQVMNGSCRVTTRGQNLHFDISKQSVIHSLAFNKRKGSFAKGVRFESDFEMMFDKQQRRLSFSDIEIALNRHPFVFSGAFHFAGEREYQLKVATEQVGYEFAKSLLPHKIAKAISVVKVLKPLDAQAQITGVLRPGEPHVTVQWQTANNSVQSVFLNLSDASFTGGYTNEMQAGKPRNDLNSALYVDNLKASWEGLQVTSRRADIINLVNPLVRCDLKSSFSLSTLNNLLESQTFQMRGGSGKLDITYSGPLQENSNRNTFINGKLSFSNGQVAYMPRKMQLDDCSGSIVFKNTDVYVNNLKCRVKDSRVTMNGSGKNLLSLIKTNPGKIELDWQISSPFLNLENLAPLLRKRSKVVTTATASRGKLRKVANQVDQMLNDANLKLELKTDRIAFKRFEATNVNAALNMVQEDWLLNNVSFNHANGRMKMSGKLKEMSALKYAAALNVQMEDVDVNKVLYSFNNFGQDALQSDNIRGKLSTNIVVAMDIDRQLASDPTQSEGFIDFSLKNGELVNFEPLQKLQNFLFKNRNFEDVKFAELKNRIEVKGKDFIINRMEIQSTALTLFVKGVYSMEGETDLSIQIPLSNLKKRGDDFKPENIGADAKAGPSIFVRGKTGEDGNIKFKLDVFNKIRKRLKGESR